MSTKAKGSEDEGGLIINAAKTIGKVAGKIANVAGVKADAETGEARHVRRHRGKLPPKDKARLPRRQKKAQKKARSSSPSRG